MAQELDSDEWPSIRFENLAMPQSLKGISILVSAEGLSERSGDWIWRLCHCKGVEKRGTSDWVAASASEIIDLLIEGRHEILCEIESRLEPHGFNPAKTFSEWVEALTTIKEVAQRTPGECRWIAGTAIDCLTAADKLKLATELLESLGDDTPE